MELLTAAAISNRNLIGEPEAAIQNIESWLQRAVEQGVELTLFPELNVSGYIPAPVAGEITETISGPSTEKIIRLAGLEDLLAEAVYISGRSIFDVDDSTRGF
jgi:predicted amidohydrolase